MQTTVRSADGTPLAARRTGSGPPLVLVHGTSAGIDSFGRVEPLLAAHRTVWAYDRRGRGGSGDTPPYGLDREVEDLRAVLAAAGGAADVVGHSFGGVVSLVAAHRGTPMRSLVLYEPPLHGDRVDRSLQARAEAAVAAGALEPALTAFFEELAGVPAAERDVLLAVPPVRAWLLDGVRTAPRELAALAGLGWRPGELPLPPDLPVLLLRGEHTTAPVYSDASGLRASVPQLTTGTLSGQRHLAMAFAPEQLAAAVLAHVDGS